MGDELPDDPVTMTQIVTSDDPCYDLRSDQLPSASAGDEHAEQLVESTSIGL